MPESAHPLAGLHAVVTGGGRGIGHAIAQRLVSMGATCTLLGRDHDRLVAAAQAIDPAACTHTVCDVGNLQEVEAAFGEVAALGRGLALLVNNAGAAKSARFDATDAALWDEMLRVNATGAYLCTRSAMPLLRAAPFARIVNIASSAGLIGYRYVSAYCAAKHALVGLTRALAVELARTNITVNAVCPGYTDTDIVAQAVDNIASRTASTPGEALAALVAHNPQGRLVTPDEVAGAVAWLCLPESAAVTGQAIGVAGGEVQTG